MNSERETKLCYVLPHFENLHQENPEIEKNYFYVLPPLLPRNGCRVAIDVKLFCQTVGG
jgi:hypothetical protein